MFDVFIIQKIRDEEERRRRQEADRPRLEVPLPEHPPEETEGDRRGGGDQVERGVLIIENDEE